MLAIRNLFSTISAAPRKNGCIKNKFQPVVVLAATVMASFGLGGCSSMHIFYSEPKDTLHVARLHWENRRPDIEKIDGLLANRLDSRNFFGRGEWKLAPGTHTVEFVVSIDDVYDGSRVTGAKRMAISFDFEPDKNYVIRYKATPLGTMVGTVKAWIEEISDATNKPTQLVEPPPSGPPGRLFVYGPARSYGIYAAVYVDNHPIEAYNYIMKDGGLLSADLPAGTHVVALRIGHTGLPLDEVTVNLAADSPEYLRIEQVGNEKLVLKQEPAVQAQETIRDQGIQHRK
jgi:hypothetical protein